MKNLRCVLYFVVGVLLSAVAVVANAGAIPFSPVGDSITRTASGSFYKAVGNVVNMNAIHNGRVDGAMAGWILGRNVSVPAVWKIGKTAASVGSIAMRASAVGIVGSVLIPWLAEYGLQYINEKFMKGNPNACSSNCFTWFASAPNGVAKSGPTAQAALDALNAYMVPLYGESYRAVMLSATTYKYTNGVSGTRTFGKTARNPDPDVLTEATDADFAAMSEDELPDDVANYFASQGVALPVDDPVIVPNPAEVPIGAPETDIYGNSQATTRMYARIAQSASDPYTPQVTVFGQEVVPDVDPATGVQKVDENGEPVYVPKVNPDGSTTKTEPKADPTQTDCQMYPNSAGCLELDQTPDSDLKNRDFSFSIIPVPGFGQSDASCPAPTTMFSKGGVAEVWEWGPYCDFSHGIRPFILAFAWIAAVYIGIGISKKA